GCQADPVHGRGRLVATDAVLALEKLWSLAGGDPAALERATLTGADPILPTDFKIGTAASSVIAAGALAASEIWRLRTGRSQSVAVDLRAAVAAFRSERYLRADSLPDLHRRDPLFGFYQAGDGRWIQLHSNMPHHRDGALKLLGCEGTREATAAAVETWKAGDLEDTFAAAGLPTGMVRSRAEWQSHPQGIAVAALPLLEIVTIGQSYRPGALARLGLGPEELARLRPGIVYVTLSAFSHAGPWRERRGFETIIQSVSGMAHEQGIEGGGGRPQHLPAQVVDHGTGY